MYTIEITLKGTPAALTVQMKEEPEATAKFREVRDAIATGRTGILELTCEKTEKQIAVLAESVMAVQLTPKKPTAGSTASRPGFLASMDSMDSD